MSNRLPGYLRGYDLPHEGQELKYNWYEVSFAISGLGNSGIRTIRYVKYCEKPLYSVLEPAVDDNGLLGVLIDLIVLITEPNIFTHPRSFCIADI